MKMDRRYSWDPSESAEFAEVFDGEVCMPPTWLYFKDLKKEYDVSVPARAAGYLSVLSFRSGGDPGENAGAWV